MKAKVIRIISIVMLVVLILTLGTGIAGAITKSNLAQKYPAPGQLVDVGGYKLHISCTGQGSPTVILEAGIGNYSLFWAYVQPEVANYTRVCSYDRAGLGRIIAEQSCHFIQLDQPDLVIDAIREMVAAIKN